MGKLLTLCMVLGATATVRKPLYLDPNTGYHREMSPLLDAIQVPAVYLSNPNQATANSNTYIYQDPNGLMFFKDPSVSTPFGLMKGLAGLLQSACSAQTTSATATNSYNVILSQSITTGGGSRVFALGFITSSNTSTSTANLGQLVYGSPVTVIASGASGYDGGSLSSSGTPSTMSMASITPTLAAGTYTFSLQFRSVYNNGGSAQTRIGTYNEGSSICLFEVSP